jgi:hypothetical protein
METKDKAKVITELNYAFRQSFNSGQVMLTAGVNELDRNLKAKLMNGVRNFSTFTKNNDPHGEHDFGRVEIEG